MKSNQIVFKNFECETEVLIALLCEMPFYSFEEEETILLGYINRDDYDASLLKDLDALQLRIPFEYSSHEMEDKNWNAVWESNFEPISIGDQVHLRANFHPAQPQFRFDIEIHPKMAFGTGHHETTHMIIEMELEADFKNKKVFDFGCGTGVLGILASKLGAKSIVGVDNEYPAYEATIENCTINQVTNFETFYGDLGTIGVSEFDVILANINRNVLLDAFPTLYTMLCANGSLYISGILTTDEEVITNALNANNFKIITIKNRGNWLAIQISK
jgi:ribosomal protein L11 methyltransferase